MACDVLETDWTSVGKEAVVHVMDQDHPIDSETAEAAERALYGSVVSLLEAALEISTGAGPVAAMPSLAEICGEVMLLTAAMAVIERRRAR